MDTWRTFIEEGENYLKTALNGAVKRKEVFTPDILYNIVSMSIEKQIMGFLMFHDRLPENHTLRDLVDAVTDLRTETGISADDFSEELREKIIRMDRFQEICCFDAYRRELPEDKDVKMFMEAGTGVQEFVRSRLHTACTPSTP